MHLEKARRVLLIITACLVVISFVADANAQTRRTKKSRRVTNPVTTTTQTATPSSTVSTTDPQIISTADEAYTDSGTSTNARRTSSRRPSSAQSGEDATRDKVDKLTAQVSALNEKLSQMEQQQRTLVDLERLSRAETRAETLRAQLRDVQTKEQELQTRTLQLEYEMQPAVIERTLAVSGSTRPEDLREQRRRQLETEKTNLQTQVNQIATSRARLETAIANADAEADRLRSRIDTALAPPATETVVTDPDATPELTTEPAKSGYDRP